MWWSSTGRVHAFPRKFAFFGFGREEPGTSRESCRDVLDPWGCSQSLCNKRIRAHCSFHIKVCAPTKSQHKTIVSFLAPPLSTQKEITITGKLVGALIFRYHTYCFADLSLVEVIYLSTYLYLYLYLYL